jgi:hypothetical protein
MFLGSQVLIFLIAWCRCEDRWRWEGGGKCCWYWGRSGWTEIPICFVTERKQKAWRRRHYSRLFSACTVCITRHRMLILSLQQSQEVDLSSNHFLFTKSDSDIMYIPPPFTPQVSQCYSRAIHKLFLLLSSPIYNTFLFIPFSTNQSANKTTKEQHRTTP